MVKKKGVKGQIRERERGERIESKVRQREREERYG